MISLAELAAAAVEVAEVFASVAIPDATPGPPDLLGKGKTGSIKRVLQYYRAFRLRILRPIT